MKSKVVEQYKQERIEIFNKRFGVIFDGEDNLKSLVVENLIDNSPTAFQCAWLYESFLGGGGFEVDMSEINLSEDEFDKQNPNNLLFDVAEVVSRHQGVFINVGYNANYEKDSFKIIPYTLCKVGKKDSADYYGKILVSPKGWGKSLKKEDVDIFDVYNPRPDVIQTQVEAAGGWENYKGQIFFFKLSRKYTYPQSLIERAYTFADTENQLGLYYNGTAKRSFEDVTVIRHRKFESKQDEEAFERNVKSLSGFENSSTKLLVEDDWDDENNKQGNIRFDTIKNEVKSEKYAHFETSSANYIRKAFKNIPPQLVDYVAGKLGNTSGEDLIKAQSIYNSLISKDQEKLEMLFKELFRNYKHDINPSNNWTIKQYSLLDDGTVNYDENNIEAPAQKTKEELDEEAIRTAQATLRGSVGGVTSILAIQASVVAKTTTLDSGVAMLINIFGYSDEVSRRILGNPEANPTNPNPNGNTIN
ncbi:hypothetical protein EV143_1188 [Flavobacterium chryseum]|uniref:hypothetical protein n=1 Tax=Flavobacterium sp. P3160 TaxID=2512113 RepID=UPI00105DF1C4|nr:hypothetical protein [Flavobacterium sp. P3160]TDO68824.1 hypothetical protein EV143_1188 [Flavobacterium sp. P3160]